MYLVAIAWIYVALMMAVAEATHSQGSVLGALITFVLYGVAPLALVLYLFGTSARRRARRAAETAEAQQEAAAPSDVMRLDPDGGGHPPRVAVDRPVAPVREEP